MERISAISLAIKLTTATAATMVQEEREIVKYLNDDGRSVVEEEWTYILVTFPN